MTSFEPPPDLGVIAHGVDLCEERRIVEMVERHGDSFLERVFTSGEREYAHPGGRLRGERLAARFAAKEAVLKALGTGWRGGMAWTDVEVVRHGSGQPRIRLAGEAAAVASRRGIVSWHLSLSHVAGLAMASVIACGPRPPADRSPADSIRS